MNQQAEPQTLQELEARRDVVEEENAALKSKLDNVRAKRHASGEWADPDWYRRATTRQRFTALELERLNRKIAELKRAQRQAHAANVERAFVAAARELLSGSTFADIMNAAAREVARHA